MTQEDINTAVVQTAIIALVGHLEGLGVTTAREFGRILEGCAGEIPSPQVADAVRVFARRMAGGLPPKLTAIDGGKED